MSQEMEREAPLTEQVFDELLPEELEWRRLAARYPLSALAAAALAGFWLGREHGAEVLSALGNFARGEVSATVGAFLGQEPLEP